MIKAFISHSSKQKEEFVEPLAELLGRDSCIIDAYDFESSYKSLDEIYRHIAKCTIFVFLVSKESLASEWCQKELTRAYEKLNAGDQLRFWPYIIDEEVDIKETPEWIYKKNCYNLKYFRTPIALARDIEQKFRSIIWKEKPELERRETLIVGRNNDVDTFEEKFYSSRRSQMRSVLISGRDGVGKEAFAKQCLQKMGKDKETIPFHINLSPKEGIEDFILELNTITGTFSSEQIKEIVLPSSATEKPHYAVKMLCDLYGLRTVLFVEDNMSIVLPNRQLPDWFCDILKDPELPSQVGMFILSKITPKTTLECNIPQVITITLNPLSKTDRKKLFYHLIETYNLQCVTDSDVDNFVERLNQSPLQLVQLAQALKGNDSRLVKSDLDAFVAIGDKKMKPIFDMFLPGDEQELLVVLSRFNFISFDVLEKIYTDRYQDILHVVNKILYNGLASTFGPSNCFLRLDFALSDYINRNHMALPQDLELLVNDVLEDYLTSNIDMDKDLSVYLLNTRSRILKGLATETDYLVPSVVIKAIVDLYNGKKYKEVIKLCTFVIKEGGRYDKDVIREIRYWYCLALCREQKEEEFYKEVKSFDGADYCFLWGFYCRIEGKSEQAESWYADALKKAPSMQRAKREYVSVLLEQGKYDSALENACENYRSAPENTYHIHAYFRCLIKKHPLHKDEVIILEELIKQVENSHSPKKNELTTAMHLEIDITLRRKTPSDILDDINEAERRFPDSPNIGRISTDFKFKQGIIKKRNHYEEEY